MPPQQSKILKILDKRIMLILLQCGKVVVQIAMPFRSMTLVLVKLSIAVSNFVDKMQIQNHSVLTSFIDQVLVLALILLRGALRLRMQGITIIDYLILITQLLIGKMMVTILIIKFNTMFQLQVPLMDRVALCLRTLTKLIVEHLQTVT